MAMGSFREYEASNHSFSWGSLECKKSDVARMAVHWFFEEFPSR